ncbi:dTDP-4-dehydrorhamnose reductase [Asticcacaulis excentricus]|uniref:dTDP-4-dehydrorhamnose reductase n=1 Tax=Asticcacaulis excentricus TaxID=78587 RepID=A0A3G9G3Y1_9CAUL|nr:dTDP-4-dehydrorhamnose reductase [Asticcacaulis excentricus]BBF81376.1 dTDP-4-dehydrorhamnose reductase [Asticcacaulis excentricus]
MRLLVTGKEGQVVTAIKQQAADKGIEIVTLGRPEADLADPESLYAPVIEAKPDVIVSAAAYTAVDKAESEAEIAEAVNGKAPGVLARAAKALNVPILHISTDYVFAGDKTDFYVESDETGPTSVYGLTKLHGEQAVAAETDNHVVLRTAWVYSPFGNNFVKTMLRLSETRDELNVVADQQGCPTSALEIARAVLEIAERVSSDADPKLRGIFHLTAQGEANWAQFAQAIFKGQQERGGKAMTVNPIPSSQYPTPAKRPANSRLSGDKLAVAYGIKLDPWEKSLDECLTALFSNK